MEHRSPGTLASAAVLGLSSGGLGQMVWRLAGRPQKRDAIDTCRKVGNNQIALLKCTSEYPAPIEDTNLMTIPALAEKFNTVVGLSDHSPGIMVPIAAVAIGAGIIEKHFILDRKMGGPDSTFSLSNQRNSKNG